PTMQFSRKQTYLAIKRVAALAAANDLLVHIGNGELAEKSRAYERAVLQDVARIEAVAWLGDHYAICVDNSAAGVSDAWTGDALPYVELPGADGYSIYTANGLLL